jgi:hypothetical protein
VILHDTIEDCNSINDSSLASVEISKINSNEEYLPLYSAQLKKPQFYTLILLPVLSIVILVFFPHWLLLRMLLYCLVSRSVAKYFGIQLIENNSNVSLFILYLKTLTFSFVFILMITLTLYFIPIHIYQPDIVLVYSPFAYVIAFLATLNIPYIIKKEAASGKSFKNSDFIFLKRIFYSGDFQKL